MTPPDSELDDWAGVPAARRPRRAIVVGALVLAALTAVGVGGWVWLRYHDDWAFKRLANSASPHCDPSIRRFSTKDRKGFWPDATRYSVAYCGGELSLGPAVDQTRFSSIADEKRDLLADPPPDRTCLAGRVVYTDSLDPGQFKALCRNTHGHLIDAIAGEPEIPEAAAGKYPTGESIDHAIAVEDRRDSALQKRAIAAYFSRR